MDEKTWKKLRCVVCPVTVLTEEAFTYDIPEGKLLTNIVVESDDNQTLDIGTTLGGTDIANGDALTGGTPLTYTTAIYGGTIYVDGPSSTTTFKFYLR